MKKLFAVLLIATFLPLSGVTAKTNEAYLESLVDEMLKEDTPAEIQSIQSLSVRQKILENDQKIDQQFARLSVDEKYQVLDMLNERKMRSLPPQMQSLPHLSQEDQLLDQQYYEINKALPEMIAMAKQKGVFLLDLSEKELKQYFKQTTVFKQKKRLNSLIFTWGKNCPLYTYDTRIPKGKPSSKSKTYGPTGIRDVINDPGELICDYEVSFNGSGSHVWGISWWARLVLNSYGGGLHKRTVNGKDHLLFGYIKTTLLNLAGTKYVLATQFIIW